METENAHRLETMLLTRQQVADILQCSLKHVDNMVRKGLMPQPIRLGTSPRFRHQDLKNWVESGCPEFN